MSRNLNQKELLWLEKLLSVNFKGREILKQQLFEAKVDVDEEFAFVSIKFIINSGVDKFPFKARVPVEMRVFQESSAPIVFLLHVVGGFIDELEILTADSSKIDINSINIQKVEYEVNKELLN